MKITRCFAIASLAILTIVACQEEPAGPADLEGRDKLSFSIEESASWDKDAATKAHYAGEMKLTSEDGGNINVSMSVMDNIGTRSETGETKGTPISSTNFTDFVTGIGLFGFLHQTASVYVGKDVTSSYDNAEVLAKTSTTHNDDTYKTHWEATSRDYYWPKTKSIDFWAWAPKAAFDAALGTTGAVAITNLAFNNASTPQTVTFNYDLKSSDATQQPDLMFAAELDATKSSVSAGAEGHVPLDMMHALSGVKFVVKATKGGKVTDISLVDVAKTGSCSFNGTTFTWTLPTTSNKATYTHNFNTTLVADTPSNFYSGTGAAATFMMIPQTLGTQKIKLTYAEDADSAPVEFTGTIPSSTITAWQAGKIYVYTITIDEEVNVNITDEVTDENVKQSVAITNTGNTNIYLRATIIANWVDNHGKIVHYPWTGNIGVWTATTHSGSPVAASAMGDYFQTNSLTKRDIGTGWLRGDDGYYYYKYQVLPEGSPRPLFDTYTPPLPRTLSSTDVAIKTAHLEMSIAVQAIQANMLLDSDGNFKDSSTYGWQTTYSNGDEFLLNEVDPE